MGFLRKTVLIGTAGLAPIKANSKKERTAKAMEKQVKLQRQILDVQQRQAAEAARVAPLPNRAQAQVVLVAVGDRKIQVIKALREITGLSLKQTKALVDHVPSTLDVSEERAESIEQALRAAGARAEIRRAETPSSSFPAEPSPGDASFTAQLSQLAEMHKSGALTDEEFAAAKQRVLSTSDAPPPEMGEGASAQ